MPYYRLFYHLIWSTKFREPLITSEIEPVIHNFIRSKTIGLGGYVYALNGTEDHVHLVAHIPRTASVAQFVGKIKGASSTRLNKAGIMDGQFSWQSEYSVFTVSEFIIPKLIHYVENQKAHHQNGTHISYFEINDKDS